MQEIHIIKVLIIVFLVSLLIIFTFKKLHLPSIVGFLIAGIVIGPHGFRLITETGTINTMAEIGAILLLFTIGLEFSIPRLLQIKRFLLVAGGSQVITTIIIASGVFALMGISPRQSIFFGMLICLSSTAFVLKLLTDKNELDSPHGKISLGILIFQDLAVIPMMLLLPVLTAEKNLSMPKLLFNLVLSFIILAAVILVAKSLIPKMLYQLAKLRVREAFTLGIIVLIFATAYLTESLGLSLALGAFISGVILSDTEFTHQAFSDIVPLKDAFNSLYFVSVGLLFNYVYLESFPFQIILLTTGIIFLKVAVILLVIIFMKYPMRVGLITGFSLAQIGEFSFVLAQVGLSRGLIGTDYYNAFLSSSIFTMLLTPLLLQAGPALAFRLRSIANKNMKIDEPEEPAIKLKDHVVIVGFGLNGKNIARVLRETGIKYVVLELNPETVREYKGKNENIIFGDVTRKDILLSTSIEKANVIVFAISDFPATQIGIKLAKELNPNIYCIVRTRFINNVDILKRSGADEVIPEEFETSLQIFTKVLQKYHIPLNVIMKQTNILRSESYQIMRNEGPMGPSMLSHLDKILAEGLTETYFVEETNPNLNKSLHQLNIRAITGATIIAFLRDGKTNTNPSGKEVLKAGDTLIIYGNHNAVDKAMNLLNNQTVK